MTEVELRIVMRAGPVSIDYEAPPGSALVGMTVIEMASRLMELTELLESGGPETVSSHSYARSKPAPAPVELPPDETYTHTEPDLEEIEPPEAETRVRLRPKDPVLAKFLDDES